MIPRDWRRKILQKTVEIVSRRRLSNHNDEACGLVGSHPGPVRRFGVSVVRSAIVQRYRISLLLAGCLISAIPARGQTVREDIPPPGDSGLNAQPLTFEIETIGNVDGRFITQIEEELARIPRHLSRQVIAAGISVYAAEKMSLVEPAWERRGESAAVYDSDPSRKRVVIDQSRFQESVGSYFHLSPSGELSFQELGSVIAHEFGHAYDWAPAYGDDGNYYPERIRSNATEFVLALNNDQKLGADLMTSFANQHKQDSDYLDYFRGKADTTDAVSPNPLREAYAEAIAVHLALHLEYRPHKGHWWFQHSFPNVIAHVRPEFFPKRDVEHSSVREAILPATSQPIPRRAADTAEATSLGIMVPTIISVHEFDRPPLASFSGDGVRIRGTRFEVDVIGLNKKTAYRLFASFDGETIGETDWVVGRDSYSIPTQVGFPPGRYCLTVQAIERDVAGIAMQTPPVFVDYQPTYLREMRHLAGRDVTAVTSHRAISHRGFEEDVATRQIQVRFVGLDKWYVYAYSAIAKKNELKPIPHRRSFTQGHLYQLKIKHDTDEFYPTLKIPRTSPQAAVFLAHNSVPVELTQPDVDYVRSGGMLTKVMYLPHRAEHPTRANCVETLISRCPGDCTDPLAEAARSGTILAVLQFGDKQLEQERD